MTNDILAGRKVKVRVPATIANLVCGFDVLGMCLHEPFDEMEVALTNTGKVTINTEGNFNLPTEPEKNTAGAPLLQILSEIKALSNSSAFEVVKAQALGFDVLIKKNIKPGSGLGSSAVSAAGAVAAANYLLGNIFTKEQMVDYAMTGEAIASGARHADNIAPCIYGGITLVRNNNPVHIVPVNFPNLYVTVVHPQIEVKTIEARAVLPKEIPLKTAIQQWANVGALIAGLEQKNFSVIEQALTDIVVEPARKHLIPVFDEVKDACMIAGALGGGIAGAGPSIFMFSKTPEIAQLVEQQMKHIFTREKIAFNTYITEINPTGLTIEEI